MTFLRPNLKFIIKVFLDYKVSYSLPKQVFFKIEIYLKSIKFGMDLISQSAKFLLNSWAWAIEVGHGGFFETTKFYPLKAAKENV